LKDDLHKQLIQITQDAFEPLGLKAGCQFLKDKNTDIIHCYFSYIHIYGIDATIMGSMTYKEMLLKTSLLRDCLMMLEDKSPQNILPRIVKHVATVAKDHPQLLVIAHELDASLQMLSRVLQKKNQEIDNHSKLKH